MKSKFKKLNLLQNNILSQDAQRAITGGRSFLAGATADCGGGKSVSCSGSTCASKDGVGCSCIKDDFSADTKSCVSATNSITEN
ncbi:hypothetical protein BKI52_43545 [marine bacterium AO1-C]|nr:hypothetical protein BKI52_43545 [marine bacterium AO1-C]